MDFLISLDQRLFEFINSTFTHPWLDYFFPLITDLHKHFIFMLIIVFGIFYLFFKSYSKKAILLFLGLIFCLSTSDFVGSQVIKANIQRSRPGDNPTVKSIVLSPYGGTSFISNHAANMFAFATFTSVFLPSFRILFFALAFLVAYSRVYVGVHFPLDIIAGSIFGLVIGKMFALICSRLLKITPVLKNKSVRQS